MNNRHGRKPAETAPENTDREPFSALGYEGWENRFRQNSTGRVFIIDVSDMIPSQSMEALKIRLIGLAPLEYWREKFPPRNGETIWELAVDSLLRQSEKVGAFNWKAPQ
jgi:hypothetical protein